MLGYIMASRQRVSLKYKRRAMQSPQLNCWNFWKTWWVSSPEMVPTRNGAFSLLTHDQPHRLIPSTVCYEDRCFSRCTGVGGEGGGLGDIMRDQIKNDSWPQCFVEHYLPKTLSLDHSEGRRAEQKSRIPPVFKNHIQLQASPSLLSPRLLHSTIQLNLPFMKKSYLNSQKCVQLPLSPWWCFHLFPCADDRMIRSVGTTWVETPLTICQCARQGSSHSSPCLGFHKITYSIKHTTCHLISLIPSLRLPRKQPPPLNLPF